MRAVVTRTGLAVVIVGVIVGVGVAATSLFPGRGGRPVASGTQQAAMTSGQFGPGRWSGEPSALVPPLPAADTSAPPGPYFDSAGVLRIDRSLRDLFDHFLLGGHAGLRSEHVAALRAHLEGLLDLGALNKVWPLAERYLVYLEEHDRLLAAGAAAPVHADSPAAGLDTDRIRSWLAQRARLRQTVLGMEVARAWFGEEERELQVLLDQWSEPGARQSAAEDEMDRTRAVLRDVQAEAASLSSRRHFIARQHGEEAALRYEEMEKEEQAWQQRMAAYREQAQLLRASTAMSAADRVREIEALRMRMFPDEAQRLRAQALDS